MAAFDAGARVCVRASGVGLPFSHLPWRLSVSCNWNSITSQKEIIFVLNWTGGSLHLPPGNALWGFVNFFVYLFN